MADKSTIGPWTPTVTSLPPIRRYICTHDPKSGTSIVHSSPPQLYHGRADVGGMARSYSTATIPAVLKDEKDIDDYLREPSTGDTGPTTSYKGTDIVGTGSNLLVVDIAPGGQSQMHRTVSVDYTICVVGLVKMELDGGEMIELRPGDHVVQRGTMHKWWNGSQTEPARFVAVTLPCEPFEIPGTGKMLKEEHVDGSGAKKTDGSSL